MKIGEKIREARKSKNYVLKDVSRITKFSMSYLSDIENDRSTPPLATLEILCKALDISLYDVLPREDEMHVQENDPDTAELHLLTRNFKDWDKRDKDELLSYLRAKNSARKEKDK